MANMVDIFGPRPRAGEIGIEIEMEGHNFAAPPPAWTSTHDGSLRGPSVEYVLRLPVHRNRVKRCLQELKSALKESAFIPAISNRCGVHVHINCQKLDTDQVFTFILLYLVFEKMLIKYCGESRIGNIFCLSAEDAEGIMYPLNEVARSGDIGYFISQNYRYASINTTALSKYGSLEFRSLQTPEDIEDIEEWVRILLCIKDSIDKFPHPSDIVEGASRDGAIEFAESIFGDLLEKIQNPDMETDIMEGLRRVQLPAYLYSTRRNNNHIEEAQFEQQPWREPDY